MRAYLAIGLGLFWGMVAGFPPLASAAELKLDESPAKEGEWGYRPADGGTAEQDPPSFSWRPMRGIEWEIECARDSEFQDKIYSVNGIEYNVHCPPKTFGAGTFYWRYRGKNSEGETSAWSNSRSFTITKGTTEMPMPTRTELLGRVPKSHPRLFVRPEKMGALRELAKGQMQKTYEEVLDQCDRIVADPPPTKEPLKYDADMARGSDPWRERWWGNRTYTQEALGSAAELGFAWLLSGKDEYGQLAKQILLDCAQWDPKGATGYRYNDEAGMPYNYYFARTYTFIHDLLSESERETCRKVMAIRGDEMFNHLAPNHFWKPYGSHQNRAWHFLGEVGIAFLGEIDEAEDWLWFAMNVFFNTYPVWSGVDGGWHEGNSYWASYQNRFTWWADIMREAMGIDAFKKPYYSKVGFYPMYLMPPNKTGGGFGDLNAKRVSRNNADIVSVFAAQAGNPYWQWYVDAVGGARPPSGYVGFVRGALPQVEGKPPDDLPNSRLFRGIGQAYLNTSLTDASQSVQIVFKSSPFGTHSHGYEANNSFLLWAYGKRLLIRSGLRDSYGSDHHKNWMWSTRSVNNITVGGHGQHRRSSKAAGRITGLWSTPDHSVDVVVGEAGDAYVNEKTGKPVLDRFTRTIIFAKPELMVVYDVLEAKAPEVFEYWLHAIHPFEIGDAGHVRVRNDDVVCDVEFLAPAGLTLSQTNEYDPNPRPRVKLREWHLTAKTAEPQQRMEFVTLYRPRRATDKAVTGAQFVVADNRYQLTAPLSDGGSLEALLTMDRSKGGFAVRRQKGELKSEWLTGVSKPVAP